MIPNQFGGFPSVPQIATPEIGQALAPEDLGQFLIPILAGGIFDILGADGVGAAIPGFIGDIENTRAVERANIRDIERSNQFAQYLGSFIQPGGPLSMDTIRQTAPAFTRQPLAEKFSTPGGFERFQNAGQ